MIPDNRPGATSNIGLELAAKAPPDGYTLVFAGPPLAVSPSLYPKLNYDAQKDLAPITLVAAMHNVMADAHVRAGEDAEGIHPARTPQPGQAQLQLERSGRHQSPRERAFQDACSG